MSAVRLFVVLDLIGYGLMMMMHDEHYISTGGSHHPSNSRFLPSLQLVWE